VDTVAVSKQRLSGTIAAMTLRRAQNQISMASRAAVKPATKNLVLMMSFKCKSLSASNDALERVIVNPSAMVSGTAAQQIPRKQKDSTAAPAFAGRATTNK
jgi:hypothetical protein